MVIDINANSSVLSVADNLRIILEFGQAMTRIKQVFRDAQKGLKLPFYRGFKDSDPSQQREALFIL